MGDTLWMDDQVHGWLAGLRTSDPRLARATAEAVLALLDAGPRLGPPLLVPAAAPRQAPEELADLDEAYQRLLEGLTDVRREVADVATARKRAELGLGEPDGAGSGGAEDQRARLDELTAAEDKLTAYSQRMQPRIEAFRIRKETLKARYTAAQAKRRINEAYRMLGKQAGELPAPFPTAEDAVSAVTAEATELLGTAAELDKELRRVRPKRGPGLRPRKARPAEGGSDGPDEPVLLSLRPAAPGCLGVRIVCAFGPPDGAAGARGGAGAGGRQPAGRGTVLLLAASAEHARLPVEPEPLLRQAEARYWAMLAAEPPAMPAPEVVPGGPVAYDRSGFVGKFFATAGAVLRGAAPEGIAAAVAARARPHRLAELRARAGLTQAEVADRLGVRQERVSAMERGDVTAMETRTAAAYIEALGGRLEITADFGPDRVILG